MNNHLRTFLIFLNVLIYLAFVPLWLSMPHEFILNLSLFTFNFSFSLIMFLSWKNRRFYFSRKKLSDYATNILNIFLIFVILGFINYLSFKNPVQFDFSKNKINSLTKQTTEALDKLNEDLSIKVFSRRDVAAQIMTILDLYKVEKHNISIELIDPDMKPELVQQYNVIRTNTVIFEYGKRREFVTENSELAYTNALIRLSRTKDPKILYSIGHGELDIDSDDKNGGSKLKNLITKSLFSLEKINLVSTEKISGDADALIIWGPKTAFQDREIKILDDYLKRGGHLIVAIDPNFNQDKVYQLRKYLERSWGLKISNSVVIDKKSFVDGSNGTVPLISSFNSKHLVSKDFSQQVFLPLTSSVQKADLKIENGRIDYLGFSSDFPHSWEDNNPREILKGEFSFDGEKDQGGPIPISASYEQVITEDSSKRARIIAFGNSTFVANAYELLGGNFSFFIHSLSWVADEKKIASFNLPIRTHSPVILTTGNLRIIFYLSVIFLPVSLFLFALFLFRKRRFV